MAGQALRVLLRNRCAAIVREADYAGLLQRIAQVLRGRAMAGLALFSFERIAGIEGENLGMDRVRPILAFQRVATGADSGIDVATCAPFCAVGRLRGRC